MLDWLAAKLLLIRIFSKFVIQSWIGGAHSSHLVDEVFEHCYGEENTSIIEAVRDSIHIINVSEQS